MRLRITATTDRATTVLHVDGELLGEGVHELERVASGVRPLRLNLKNLQRADASGLAVLRRLQKDGVELVSVPPYIALLLERVSGAG